MKPTVGRIVHYKLGAFDAAAINSRRDDATAFRRSIAGSVEPGQPGRTGHVEHSGNRVGEGEVYPAVIVRTFGSTTVNLHVLLDGNDTFWATSRTEGGSAGEWSWPQRED